MPQRPMTLPELAKIAREAIEGEGLSQAAVADRLNDDYSDRAQRGRFHRAQVSSALNDPGRNPGMVLLLVEAFTPWKVDDEPRYTLSKK